MIRDMMGAIGTPEEKRNAWEDKVTKGIDLFRQRQKYRPCNVRVSYLIPTGIPTEEEQAVVTAPETNLTLVEGPNAAAALAVTAPAAPAAERND